MYIAFKWLLFLAFIQWLCMCIVHILVRGNMDIKNTDTDDAESFDNYKNESLKTELPASTEAINKETLHSYNKDQNTAFQFIMFIAGALGVMAYQKKHKIITLAQQQIINIAFHDLFSRSKIATRKFSAAIMYYFLYIQEKIVIISLKLCNKINSLKTTPIANKHRIHIILLKKLKEIAEERKSLSQLLISALRENKNIRMQYELETKTKNRLMQHIEDTQKQAKVHRSRYVSFHQLYLLTRQENIYLKARLEKLKKEKGDTEKDLMGLINEVYLSQNKDLKTYCTRFLVKTKDKLLHSDVGAEIKEFLESNRKSSEISLSPKIQVNNAIIPSSTSIRITEIVNEEDCLVPIATDAPKLRGLPGEYVWTFKDKNGIIEKLYGYDYESESDSGDTIKRIRQYSVYFDKDCLLDFSRTEHLTESVSCASRSSSKNMLNLPLNSNKKLVTGTEAFQNFLKSRATNIVQIKPSAAPLL